MVVHNVKDLQEVVPHGGEAVGTRGWLLVGKKDGATNFYMRLFEVEPGGNTPRHSHPWEHEVYVIEGSGKAHGKDRAVELKAGDALFIPPDEYHFISAGSSGIKFICCIPSSADAEI